MQSAVKQGSARLWLGSFFETFYASSMQVTLHDGRAFLMGAAFFLSDSTTVP